MIVTLTDYYSDDGQISVASDAGSGDILATKDYTAAQSYLSGGSSATLRILKTLSASSNVNYIAICSHNMTTDNVISIAFLVNNVPVFNYIPKKRTHNILVPFDTVAASNVEIRINKRSVSDRILVGFMACGFSRVVPNEGEQSGFSYGHLFTPTEVRTATNDKSQPTASVTWTKPVKHTLSLPNIERSVVKDWWFDFTDAAKSNGWFIMLAEDLEPWTASLCFDVRDMPRKSHSQTRGLVTSQLMFTGSSGV